MPKQKLKTYRIFTKSTVGWIYEVKARTPKEAKEDFWNGEFEKDYLNHQWEGDSGEEIEDIVLVKKPEKIKKQPDIEALKDALNRIDELASAYAVDNNELDNGKGEAEQLEEDYNLVFDFINQHNK